MIKYDDMYVELQTDNDWWYEIPMLDLRTVSGLSQWLCHLNEKNWFTKHHENILIGLCERKFNYKFDGDRQYKNNFTDEQKKYSRDKIADIKNMLSVDK